MPAVIHVGPGVDEELERIGVFTFLSLATSGAAPGGSVECVERVGPGAVFQKKLDGFELCVVCRPRKDGTKPAGIRRIDVGSAVDETPNESELSVVGGIIQGGAAFKRKAGR